jgi:hypothetical protein
MVPQATANTYSQVVKPKLREYLPDGSLKLNFHPGQLRAWKSEARFVSAVAGFQSGKTAFAPHWLMREIHRRGNGDYLYVSSTFTLLQKKAIPELREVFEFRSKLGKYKKADQTFVFSEAGMRWIHAECDEDGCRCHEPGNHDYDPDKATTIFFGHANNAESLESATAKAAVCDEAGQEDFKLESWDAIQRRLALYEGRALIISTPYNFGWLKTEIHDRWMAGDTDYDVINFPSMENPSFPKAEAARMKRTLPRWKYEMFVLGLFSKPAGLIYDCFDPDTNKTQPILIPNTWKRVIGIDFGGINTAAVKIAIHPTLPRFYIYDQYYPRVHRSSAEHACYIMEHEPTVNVDWRISKARPVPTLTYRKSLYTIIAGSLSERQWRTEIASSGIEVHPTLLKDVELGIDRVYDVLKQRWLQVFDLCRNVISEFGSYSRELDADGNPIPGTIVNKAKYHLLDAIRYAVSSIADPNQVEDWTEDDMRSFQPDTDAEIAEMLEMLDDDVNLDSPRVRMLLMRQQALMYRPHTRGQHEVIDVEPEM